MDAKSSNEFDIIVVGGGGSGLATAASAIENGAKVLLLEKQSRLGGTTGMAVGSFTANRTSYQFRAGIEDSLADHDEDCGRFARSEIESRNATELRRFFLSHTAETLEWLRKKGLVFHGPSPEPPNRVPRMHNVVPSAKAYIDALSAVVKKGGGRIECNASVIDLIRSENAIEGVDVRFSSDGREESFYATSGVVLAAGDYANSSRLIARFKGDEFSQIEGINPNSHGDGHSLVESVGGALVNMDITYGPELRFVPPKAGPSHFLSKLPTRGPFARYFYRLTPWMPKRLVAAITKRLIVTWQHPEDSLFQYGAILVNGEGKRFCDETKWPEREIAVARQPDKVAFILLNEETCEKFSRWPHFVSTAPQIAYAYVDDYLRLRPDVSFECKTLEALAKKAEISPHNLIESAAGMQPGSRWVLLGPVKAYFTTTEGGAAINQEFSVLDKAGEPIRNLYAVGQNGLGGQILWGHGLHIAWAITSGRLCGQYLARL